MVVVVAAVGVFAGKRSQIDSHWRDRDVVIDGDNSEWAGPLRPLEENHPIVTAAVNDGQFLYVVLSTSDATVRRQILRQGLIVWFDPSGGDKKHFGVKFPVGLLPEEAAGRGRGGYRRGSSERPPDDQGSGDPAQPDRPEPTNRLEVYGPQKDDAHSFVTDMAPGIAVKIGQVEGYLVYELKVPLARTADTPYAIESKPGALIGFGLETPKIERPAREGGGGTGGFGGGGGGGGGGMGGRGGRGGGGMGGRRGGGGDDRNRPEPAKPLKSWATIQLAGSR
jgi:hypothetical protein